MAAQRKTKLKVDHAMRLRARRIADLRAVELPDEFATLETAQDIEITRSGEKRGDKKVGEDVARRLDVFLSIEMSKGAYEAARRLEADMLANRGEDDQGQVLFLVDHSRTDRGGPMDRKLAAGDRVRQVMDMIGLRDRTLLGALICPSIHQHWRATVEHVTGEKNANAQAAAVRYACGNLSDAYATIDGVR